MIENMKAKEVYQWFYIRAKRNDEEKKRVEEINNGEC